MEAHDPAARWSTLRQVDSPSMVRQIHSLVADLIAPRPLVYWVDFLLSMAIGVGGFRIFHKAAPWSPWQVLGFLVAGFAFHRALSFIHEVAHHRHGSFRYFRHTWNLLCGIPFLMPSFIYDDHKVHHVKHLYGTPEDAEYLPLGTGTLREVAIYFGQIVFVPLLHLIRFLVLAPLSWLIPPLRRVVWERMSNTVASALGLANWPTYRRSQPESGSERWEAVVLEACCFVYSVALVITLTLRPNPWTMVFQVYAVSVFATALNYLRAMATHRFTSEGRESTYVEQLLDSNTVLGLPIITEMWAPLGLCYHALHHVVPSIPYHNLGIAHRRLMSSLPADSPYRATICSGLCEALGTVLRHAFRGPSTPPHFNDRNQSKSA